MATIIYWAGLDYDKLPTAKRRKLSDGPRPQYVNPAYHDSTSYNGQTGNNYQPSGTNNPSPATERTSGYSSSTIQSVQSNNHRFSSTPPGSASSNFSSFSSAATINYYENSQQNGSSYGRTSFSSQENVRRNASDRQQPPRPIDTNQFQNSYSSSSWQDNNYSNRPCKRPMAQAQPKPMSGPPPDDKKLHETLKQYFNFSAFRENQLASVNATCQGLDTLILMPTGGGKSICYQLPAILSNGLTIVVSPLKSLIADQVNRMQSLNVKTSALSGETKENEADSIYNDLRQDWPEHKLLYVTPEKINASGFLMSVFQRLYERNMLARFVIDEAHCVSTWGADFRPDYRKLGKLRELFPGVPIMALTATAPPKVRNDILEQLGMDPLTSRVFIQSFNRPNLKFEVKDKSKGCLVEICNQIRASFRHQCGIIYCLSRNDCEQTAAKLREQGITSAPYHAGLSDESRKKVFAAWSRGTFQVVCATIAFGMGIDKADVRFVIHYSMPKSIEGYYQEAGRAGRDGKTANCILYFSRSDLYRMKSMLNKTGFGRKAEDKKRDVGNLQHMIDYVDNKTECRRTILLRYLGEEFDSAECVRRADTACDNCFKKITRR